VSWPISRLGEVISFIRGVTFTPEDQVEPFSEGSTVVMRTKNVQVAGLDQSDLIAVPSGFVRRKEQALREGDILVSSANSWELVGKASYVPKLTYEATAGGFISIVRAKESRVDSRYLYHWVACPATQHKIRHCGRQTTNISNLDVGRFQDLEIPLPPLPEQKRIAAILDKADAIRRKRQQAIQLADDFLRAVFLDMFGDPVTNPKGFPVGTIRDLVDTANYGSSAKASETEGEFPMLRMGNITYSGAIDFSGLKYVDLSKKDQPKYLVEKGDLLFNRTNSKELVGKTAVYDRDDVAAIAGYLIRVRMNEKGNSYYVSGYLNSTHGKSTLQSMCKSIVGMANINAQEMQNIQILLPPIEIQNKYAAIFQTTKQRLRSQSQSEGNLADLFSAISQKAFRGEC